MSILQNSKFKAQNFTRKRGALLLELLIAISILAVVLSVGTQAVFVSMQSGKTSAESDVAIGLANEALEAVRGTAEEKWQNIYSLAGKGSTHYYPVQSSGKWTLVAGDEAIALNTASYTRYVTIQNVCRDTTVGSRSITGLTDTNGTLTTCVTSGGTHDPSTQQGVATVSWQGTGSPVVVSSYFFRWRNKVCNQADWSGGTGSGVKNCSDTSYDTKDAAIDTSGGSLKLQ